MILLCPHLCPSFVEVKTAILPYADAPLAVFRSALSGMGLEKTCWPPLASEKIWCLVDTKRYFPLWQGLYHDRKLYHLRVSLQRAAAYLSQRQF